MPLHLVLMAAAVLARQHADVPIRTLAAAPVHIPHCSRGCLGDVISWLHRVSCSTGMLGSERCRTGSRKFTLTSEISLRITFHPCMVQHWHFDIEPSSVVNRHSRSKGVPSRVECCNAAHLRLENVLEGGGEVAARHVRVGLVQERPQQHHCGGGRLHGPHRRQQLVQRLLIAIRGRGKRPCRHRHRARRAICDMLRSSCYDRWLLQGTGDTWRDVVCRPNASSR